jgi:two-component system NtrC family sensor kinase
MPTIFTSMEIGLTQFLNSSPIPIFIIDQTNTIIHWNSACEKFFGLQAKEMVGTRNQWKPFYKKERPILVDLLLVGTPYEKLKEIYGEALQESTYSKGAYEAVVFNSDLGEGGMQIKFTVAPLFNNEGKIIGAFEMFADVSAQLKAEEALKNVEEKQESLVLKRTQHLEESNQNLSSDLQYKINMEKELIKQNAELISLNEQLKVTQERLIQSDKLASIGQLAAGVAHEINNPTYQINLSNIGALEKYLKDLFDMLDYYESIEIHIQSPEVKDEINKRKNEMELAYLKEDIPDLMTQSKDGIDRVRKIVQSLKDFSHADLGQEWQWVNIHHGIDSTLNVINNEVKYKADIIKEYGVIPDIECLPSQLNQVIMNLVANASYAMRDDRRGVITIRTSVENELVKIEVSDNGCGIPEHVVKRIFEPFFTTKPVGKGTGLGLSLSYGVIKNHQGDIEVKTKIGEGTTFTITIPVKHLHGDDIEKE